MICWCNIMRYPDLRLGISAKGLETELETLLAFLPTTF